MFFFLLVLRSLLDLIQKIPDPIDFKYMVSLQNKPIEPTCCKEKTCIIQISFNDDIVLSFQSILKLENI